MAVLLYFPPHSQVRVPVLFCRQISRPREEKEQVRAERNKTKRYGHRRLDVDTIGCEFNRLQCKSESYECWKRHSKFLRSGVSVVARLLVDNSFVFNLGPGPYVLLKVYRAWSRADRIYLRMVVPEGQFVGTPFRPWMHRTLSSESLSVDDKGIVY